MKKKAVCFTLRAVAFVLASVALFQYASWVARDKTSSNLPALYEEEENRMDVVFVGSSHVYRNVNPSVMWDEYGIAGYCAASSNQSLWLSYHYIKEVLNHQRPRVVVVDLFSVALIRDDYDSLSRSSQIATRKSIQMMRDWRNWLTSIWDAVPPGEQPTYYIDALHYHDSLRNSGEGAYDKMNGVSYVKGNYPVFVTKGVKGGVIKQVDEEGEVSPKHREYLDKLIDLSNEYQFKLLFINAPYLDTTLERGISSNEQKQRMNAVSSYLKSKDIPFIDYSRAENDCGIDWAVDTYDKGIHLNDAGSVKYSLAIGAYLKEHFELPDRRGDPLYASWDVAYQKYCCLKRNAALVAEKNPAAYLEKLQQEDYLVVIASNGKRGTEVTRALAQSASALGLTLDLGGFAESYLAVLDDGGVVCEESGNTPLTYFSEKDGVRLNVKSVGTDVRPNEKGGARPAAASSVYINCKELSKNKEGVNIVVYDKTLGQVADRCWFPLTPKSVVAR